MRNGSTSPSPPVTSANSADSNSTKRTLRAVSSVDTSVYGTVPDRTPARACAKPRVSLGADSPEAREEFSVRRFHVEQVPIQEQPPKLGIALKEPLRVLPNQSHVQPDAQLPLARPLHAVLEPRAHRPVPLKCDLPNPPLRRNLRVNRDMFQPGPEQRAVLYTPETLPPRQEVQRLEQACFPRAIRPHDPVHFWSGIHPSTANLPKALNLQAIDLQQPSLGLPAHPTPSAARAASALRRRSHHPAPPR
jgi:hypothetical protein